MGPKLKNIKKLQQKEERSSKYNINQRKKDSYLADDNNFQAFAKQLSKIGLELRDINGDGNCLFRALSDQLDGTESNHLLYRRQVCDYMRKNRVDFEPFVVGLVDEIEHRKRGGGGNVDKNLEPFERYVNYLEQPGTYGGNDALVAFSRLHEVDIFLHQIDQPIWKVNGAFFNSKHPAKQLHLSYHNGEHYSSVRKIGDLNNTPANIFINTVEGNNNNNNNEQKINKKNNKSNYDYSNNASYYDYLDNNNEYLDDQTLEISNELNNFNMYQNDSIKILDEYVLDNIINVTNCFDVNLIKDVYYENNQNVEMTISRLLSISNPNTQTNNNNNTSSNNDFIEENENNENIDSVAIGNDNTIKKNNHNKNRNLKPREKKLLKKQRQMERQQIKILESRENERSQVNQSSSCANHCNHNNNFNDDHNEDVINLPANIEAKSI